ncbi:MAG TPA: DUF1622 domain-containing protein [Gemmatimonadales bacterium]|nr:DUF1622 domain-containing protein [Gemmatimonadales bacterium]
MLQLPAPSEWYDTVEATVNAAVQWLRLGVETLGAVVIGTGAVFAMVAFLGSFSRGRREGYTGIRLTLARYLALALEFQLAADILSTAIAPSWTQIGKLGAIAVIRTGLNYFLEREMESELARTEQRFERAAKQGGTA